MRVNRREVLGGAAALMTGCAGRREESLLKTSITYLNPSLYEATIHRFQCAVFSCLFIPRACSGPNLDSGPYWK